MDEKETNRITTDELGRMINAGFNDVARKADLTALRIHVDERFDEVVAILRLIPTRDEFADFKTLKDQMGRVRSVLREKLGVEV